MNVAEQIIATVQSGAIPILAIMTFLAVISTMKAPGKQTSNNENDFKITESSFWLMIAFYCVAEHLLRKRRATDGSRRWQGLSQCYVRR